MERGLTGRWVTTAAQGETVRAFVPDPLPPRPPLEMDSARQRRLERALLALGRLDSIGALLPDPHLFLYTYVRKEAVLSSQIEGTQSSLADLLLFELEEAPGVPFEDVVEVSNYVAALHHGLARLESGFPLSNRLIREVHARLLARGRGSTRLPGEFRRTQNWIGGARPGEAVFVPPPPQHVEECMAALERFLHSEEAMPVLLRAALAHVQFETIHPFLDGNGRTGRLLITLILYASGVLGEPLLYLSLYFKQYRELYYEMLNRVRFRGDWEAWVDFFLEGVEAVATQAVVTARRLVDLFAADAARVQGAGRAAGSALRVLGAFRERPVLTIPEVRRRTGLSWPAAAKGVEVLSRLGMVRELTGRPRNRVFVYSRYLEILNEGV